MCLVALALGQSRHLPVVLASNRDEFFDRPAAPLAWWQPAGDGPALLGGRDLQAGGSWLGLSRNGRLALLTNVRDGARPRPQAPSRGGLVPCWLRGEVGFERYWHTVGSACYSGFNLIAADLRSGEWIWASNAGPAPRRLDAGLYGLSNAALDTPWPKTERLKAELGRALQEGLAVEPLVERLLAALADPRLAPDAELPSTGVTLQWEQQLSAAFIRTPDGRYGTRCSTVLVVERAADGATQARLVERSFSPDGAFTTRTETVALPFVPA